MTTIAHKTVTATLVDGVIKVAGANKHLLCETPDTTSRLEAQKEWRSGVRDALIAAGADQADVWTASWQPA